MENVNKQHGYKERYVCTMWRPGREQCDGQDVNAVQRGGEQCGGQEVSNEGTGCSQCGGQEVTMWRTVVNYVKARRYLFMT